MLSNLLKTLLLFSTILIILSCGEVDVEINSKEDLESFIIEEMDYQNIPALSVLIFKGKDILYENYFGYSNIEKNVPLADNHLFLMASISKVITGTALLQLYEKNLIDLDDNINDYLPFKVSVPGYSEAITFRMLLTHTSGIADNYYILDEHYFYNKDSPVSLSYFMENYLAEDGEYYYPKSNYYKYKPGTKYNYSNVGSALIGVLVEEISGADFNTYCKKNIFTPMGMKNTFWRLDEISQTMVTPYDYSKGKNVAIQQYTNTDYPNGGLRTTALDMHKFISTLSLEGKLGDFKLLKASTINEMLTPQIESIGDEEVGLHIFLMNRTYNLWGHDGGEQGVATIMAFNPTTKIGAIIFANQGNADLDEMLINSYKLGLLY